MSTLKVNTIQTNTGSGVDIDSPLDSINVTNSATIGGNLQVNNILPSVGTNVAIGTAGGSVTLTGSVTGSSIINTGVTTVSAGSTSAPSISPTGDSNTGIFFPSADTIAFAEGGVESLRVDSSGNLGIGTNNPTTELEVLGTGTVASFRGKGGSSFIGIKDEDDGTLAFIGVDGGSLKFQTSGSGYSDKLIIDTSGNLGINSTSPARKLDVVDSGASGSVIRSRVTTNNGGYLAYEALNSSGTSVFNVTHNGRINLSENIVFASGQGLDFSATANSSGTMTSELLSDYEEGTWTPVMKGTSVAGTWSAQSTNGGFYVKVGKQVTAWANVFGSLSGASGNTRIIGLPYTRQSSPNPSGAGNANYSTGSIQYWSGISVMAQSPLIEPSNEMYFHTYTTTSSSGAEVAVVNAGHNLHFFVTYFTA